jgi:hypothetical protein
VEVPRRKNRKKKSKQLRITILGKARCVLLHFDSSKRCVCLLYKFVYAFKFVKLFLKHPLYCNILPMHGPINVKSPNNISKWQVGFNSAFKGLITSCCTFHVYSEFVEL